jgi:PAS domain S-box-containing protein
LITTEGHHSDIENRVPFLGGRSFLHVALGAAAVFVTYFFAARLSLALISPSSGVAVFWPAAGVASGLIIALGSMSRLPVALGVMLATIAANLLEDSNLPASIVFAVCNAAEALLIGWLVKSYLSENLALDSLRNVSGFLAATAVGTAVSGIGGTAGYILFHNLGASAPGIWFAWFASDALGVVTVAPVIIGLITMAQSLPQKGELLEGLVALVAIALVSTLGFSSPTEHWFTILPVSLVLPVAFWVAARCPPVFAASAAFIVAFAAVWTITFGLGRLGDAAIPLTDRVLAAQSALLAMSSALLLLAALFQERRRAEAALKEGKDRFRRLLGALPAAIHTTDTSGRITYCNKAAVEMWGLSPELDKDKCSDLGRLYYPDGTLMPVDLCPTKLCLTEGRAIPGREALFERPDGRRIPIIPYPAPLLDELGAVVGVVSMKLDITERKKDYRAQEGRSSIGGSQCTARARSQGRLGWQPYLRLCHRHHRAVAR